MSESAQRRLREDGRQEFSHKYIADTLNVKKRGKTEHGNFLGYLDIYHLHGSKPASMLTFNCQPL